MNFKKVIYIGIIFCLACLFQIPVENSQVESDAVQLVAEQTDFLFPGDGQDQDARYNDQAIVPFSSNAINGRQNSNPNTARVQQAKRLQARYALSNELICAAMTIRPGNFIDDTSVNFPSGLLSSHHHLILLHKLRN